METVLLRYLVVSILLVSISTSAPFYPTTQPLSVRTFNSDKSSPQFRSILIDPSGQYAYVGARGSVYKLQINSDLEQLNKQELSSIKDIKPSFKDR